MESKEGRSELENVRLKERKKEKEGERGRKRAKCRRYRGKKGKTESTRNVTLKEREGIIGR